RGDPPAKAARGREGAGRLEDLARQVEVTHGLERERTADIVPATAEEREHLAVVEGCVPALRREQVPERDPAARRVDLRVANKETGFTLEEPVAPRDGAVDCVLDDRGRAPEGRPARVVERRVPLEAPLVERHREQLERMEDVDGEVAQRAVARRRRQEQRLEV